MDYTDEQPSRWWVLHPARHEEKDLLSNCVECKTAIPQDVAIPRTADGALCNVCAPQHVSTKAPVTVTYLKWLEEGDPRWWSPFLCNCEECTLEGHM